MADKVRRAIIFKKIIEGNRRSRRVLENALHIAMSRRRAIVKLCFISLLLLLQSRQNATPINRPRRLQRNSGWWDLVWNTYSEERFVKTFRVSRRTFCYILSRIRHVLERKTVNEQPVSPELRLAICLYRLARGDYCYTISELVGLGVSTVATIVREVSHTIVETFWQECVSRHLPQNQHGFERKILDMEELWQFPFAWGAIDGCHIPVKCPPGGLQACKEYHNFKNFYSIVLMAIVDSNYRFLWGSCGFPGNSHDSVIFQSTDLWTNIKEKDFIPNIGQQVGDVSVPPLLLGDSAFPFQPWLMKPYTNAVLTPEERYFNYRLSRARMVTEGAYGQLKGRWRVLLRKCESSTEVIKVMTLACMVLHNICIDRGDTMCKQLDLTLDPLTNERRDRDTIRKLLKMRSCPKTRDSCGQASNIRDSLCDKLWKEKLRL